MRSTNISCRPTVPCATIVREDVAVGASLVAQTVKNLPAMQETWVWSLAPEEPL